MLVYAVVDDALSPTFPLGDALEVYLRREDAERFIEEVRGDEPEVRRPCVSRRESSRAGELNYLRLSLERVAAPRAVARTAIASIPSVMRGSGSTGALGQRLRALVWHRRLGSP